MAKKANATYKGKASIIAIQRNYQYEQKAREAAGLPVETEQEWRDRVTLELSIQTLQTYSVNFIASVIVFHDRDYQEDGSDKGLHVHGIEMTDSHAGITQEQAKAIFGCSCDENCQKVNAKTKKHVAGAFQYLLHQTAKAIADMKTRYAETDLIISLADHIHDKYKDCRRGILQFYYEMSAGNANVVDDTPKQDRQTDALNSYRNAVLSGQITADEAFDMIREDRACLDFDVSVALKEEDKLVKLEKRYINTVKKYCTSKNTDWCKTSIYISGDGGSGKSNLADAFAMRHSDARGFHRVSSQCKKITFDMADGYSMERVSVINEVQGDSFGISQFLSTFDGRRAEKVGSRHEDSFYAPEYVLFTNSTPVEEFIYDICHDTLRKSVVYCGGDACKYVSALESSKEKDKILQVRRRFAVNCEIKDGYLGVFYRVDREKMYEHRLYTDKSYEKGHECFVLYNSMKFDKNDTDCINAAVTMIEEAVAEYYRANAYSVNPLNSGWTWAMDNHVFGDTVELPNASDAVVSVHQDSDSRKICVKETGYECTTEEFAENIDKIFDTIETVEKVITEKVARSAVYGTADKFGVYSGVKFAPTIDGHYKVQYSFYDADLHQFVDTDLCAVLPDGTVEMLQHMGYSVFTGRNVWCSHFIAYVNKMFYRSDMISFYYKQHGLRFMAIRDRMKQAGYWIETERDRAERERLEQINAKIDANNFRVMTGNI